jgi:hypothetical protein
MITLEAVKQLVGPHQEILPKCHSNEVDTLRSKLEIVDKRLNEIIHGRYSDIESPKAIARQLRREIGLGEST